MTQFKVHYTNPDAKLGQPRQGDAGFDIYTPFDIDLPAGKSEINLPFNQEFFKQLMDAAETSEYIVSTIATAGFGVVKAPTGIHVRVPDGHIGFVADRSSVGAKAVTIMGRIVDSSYTGEIFVMLVNLTDKIQHFEKGTKIAQLILIPVSTPTIDPVESIEKLGETERGQQGFGSTGK